MNATATANSAAGQRLGAHAAGFGDAGAQPLRHWTDAQLAGLAALLGLAQRAWADGWGLDRVDVLEAAAEGADGPPPADHGAWLALHAADTAARAWIAPPPGAPAATGLLRQALFDAAPEAALSLSADIAGVSHQVCETAWTDLRAMLADALRLVPAAAPAAPAAAIGPDDCRPWSGAVLVRLPMPGSAWRLLLNGACVAQLAAPAPAPRRTPAAAPTALLTALRDQPLTLRAALGGVEMTLGGLRSLAVGDVIRLPHALDEPLSLIDADGRAVCPAFLGSQRGWRALELLAAPAPPKPAAGPGPAAATAPARPAPPAPGPRA